MAKKTIRSESQGEYRRKVAEGLHDLRSQWKDWKDVAHTLYNTLQNDSKYLEAKKWIFIEKDKRSIWDLDELLEWLFIRPKGIPDWGYEHLREEYENLVNLKLKALCEILESEDVVLTKEQCDNLKTKLETENWRHRENELWPKFWEIGVRKLSQKDKEDVLFHRTWIYKFELPTVEKVIQASENKEFIYYMFQVFIYDWKISKISSETEKKFLDTIFTNHSDKVRILKMLLLWFKDRDGYHREAEGKRVRNLPSKMKESLTSELKDENFLNSFVEKLDKEMRRLFRYMLTNLNVTIPRDIAKELPVSCSYWDNDDLREILDLESFKTALNNMFEKQDSRDYKLFWIFPFDMRWSYVDEKYKTPKYLNPHIDHIKRIEIPREAIVSLLRKLKETPKSWEKYNVNVQKLYNRDGVIRDADDELIDLIVDTVELDKNSDSRLLYRMMKRKWEVDENIMFNIIENIWKMESFKGENDFKKALMQEIYGTKNKRLIVELFENFKYFDKCCTEEEKDILIRQFVHVMSDEDVRVFKRIMEQHSDGKIKSGLLLKIRYFLGDIKKLSDYRALPKDVYIDAVKRKNIGSYDRLPRVIPTPYIDLDDFEKLAQFIHADRARIQKEKEDTERLKKEVRDNREKWDVLINYTEPNQKYVLSIDRVSRNLKFISENLWFHYNIHTKYIKDGRCLWWWRIHIDDQWKSIVLHWQSESYWFVPNEYEEAMKKMLEKQYPNYDIML